MKNNTNDKILHELFGNKNKKALGKLEAKKNKMGTYKPVDSLKDTSNFINQDAKGSVYVTDVDEVKKRLTSTLGMAIGNNTIQSLASKATKKFQIIVSDDIQPDTLVMLKTMLEERYASYIDLLISNQVISLGDFDSGSTEGNIAIQALDKFSTADFSKNRIANQAKTGKLSIDDVMKNSPIWNLLRINENYKTGDGILDTLLENAIICESKDVNKVKETLYEEMYNAAVTDHLNTNSQSSRTRTTWKNVDKSKHDSLSISVSDKEDKSVIVFDTAEKCVDLQGQSNVRKYILIFKKSNGSLIDISTNFDIAGKSIVINSDLKKLEGILNDNDHINDESLTAAGLHKDIDLEKVTDALDKKYSYKFKLKTKSAKTATSKTDIDVTRDWIDDHTDYRGLNTDIYNPSALVAKNTRIEMEETSIANILNENNEFSKFVKERYAKASYLLCSNRIAGTEFIAYCTIRLGLPISKEIRKHLILEYPTTSVFIDGVSTYYIKGGRKTGKLQNHNPDDIEIASELTALHDRISNNEHLVLNTCSKMVALSAKDVMEITTGAVAGGLLGTSLGALTALTIGSVAFIPMAIGAAVGALTIGGIALAKKLMNRKNKQIKISNKIEGWERVEEMIDSMMKTKKEVLMHATIVAKDNAVTAKDFIEYYNEDTKLFNEFNVKFNKMLNNTKTVSLTEQQLPFYDLCLTDDVKQRMLSEATEILNEMHDSPTDLENRLEETATHILTHVSEHTYGPAVLTEEILNEKGLTINTRTPIHITKKVIKGKEIEDMIPDFMYHDKLAYGSVEYDKRQLKDRKFNDPLVITIKFKERYGDDKFADNELTAVIGILGVITRVPSDEMAYILKSNAEGLTLNNFLKPDGDLKDQVAGMLGNLAKSKMSDNLPISDKLWHNLEKVGQLAIVNSLKGNNNGNISNAHIIFSQKEIDMVKDAKGINYLDNKNIKLVSQLMKKYSASFIGSCNDVLQLLYTYDDPSNISWDVAPYSAYMTKSSGDNLSSALTQIGRNLR